MKSKHFTLAEARRIFREIKLEQEKAKEAKRIAKRSASNAG
ncbi:MAG TPA: hypothetical protein VMU84_10100 [Thermoanaerobaculia bacterium]|nr:hypothetical protein [Thermoanaerobaculia bacterium]